MVLKKKLFLVLFVLLFDQLIKRVVLIFDLHYLINSGISFGFFRDEVFIFLLHLLILLVLLFVVLKYKIKRKGILLIFAGGLSNFIDRLLYGGVFDFIHILFFPWFNFADIFITVGILWYLFDMINKKENR